MMGRKNRTRNRKSWTTLQHEVNDTQDHEDEQSEEVYARVVELFDDKLDTEVITLILEECDYKESEAIQKLFQLVEDTYQGQPQPELLSLDIIACNILEYGNNTTPPQELVGLPPVTELLKMRSAESQPKNSATVGKTEKMDTEWQTYDHKSISQALSLDKRNPRLQTYDYEGISSLPWGSGPCDIDLALSGNSVVSTPHVSDLKDQLQCKVNQLTDKELSTAPVHRFPREKLEGLARNAGFRSERCDSLSFENSCDKLPAVSVPGFGVASSTPVNAVRSAAAFYTGSCETGSVSVESTYQSGKSDAFVNQPSSKVFPRADAPEFHPSFSLVQASGSLTSGSFSQYYMPGYFQHNEIRQPGSSALTGTSLERMSGKGMQSEALSVPFNQIQPGINMNMGMNRYAVQNQDLFRLPTPLSMSETAMRSWASLNYAAAAADSHEATSKVAALNSTLASSPRPSPALAAQGAVKMTFHSASNSASKSTALERIKQRGAGKFMVLMRGLPGSGKSYLARQIKGAGQVFSTDDYFCRGHVYDFTREKLPEAHSWNQRKVRKALEEGVNPVIVDNTNLELWEMLPYAEMAISRGYGIEILEPETQWKFKPKLLAKYNMHGVSIESIKRMKDRYEPVDTARLMDHALKRLQNQSVRTVPQSSEPIKRIHSATAVMQHAQGATKSGQKTLQATAMSQGMQAVAKPGQKVLQVEPDQSAQVKPKRAQRKQRRSKKELTSVKDYCLHLQSEGAKEEEVNAWILLANLSASEVNEVKDYLKCHRDKNRPKTNEGLYLGKDLLKTSKEYYDSRSAHNLTSRIVSETYNNREGALVSEMDGQNIKTMSNSESGRSSADSPSWDVPQPQRFVRTHAHSELGLQCHDFQGVSIVSEDDVLGKNIATEGNEAAHIPSWDAPRPQRGERIPKSSTRTESERRGIEDVSKSPRSSSEAEVSSSTSSLSSGIVDSIWGPETEWGLKVQRGRAAQRANELQFAGRTVEVEHEITGDEDFVDNKELRERNMADVSRESSSIPVSEGITGVSREPRSMPISEFIKVAEMGYIVTSKNQPGIRETDSTVTDIGRESNLVPTPDATEIGKDRHGDVSRKSSLATSSDSGEIRDVEKNSVPDVGQESNLAAHSAGTGIGKVKNSMPDNGESSWASQPHTSGITEGEENSEIDVSRESSLAPNSDSAETEETSLTSKTDTDREMEVDSSECEIDDSDEWVEAVEEFEVPSEDEKEIGSTGTRSSDRSETEFQSYYSKEANVLLEKPEVSGVEQAELLDEECRPHHEKPLVIAEEELLKPDAQSEENVTPDVKDKTKSELSEHVHVSEEAGELAEPTDTELSKPKQVTTTLPGCIQKMAEFSELADITGKSERVDPLSLEVNAKETSTEGRLEGAEKLKDTGKSCSPKCFAVVIYSSSEDSADEEEQSSGSGICDSSGAQLTAPGMSVLDAECHPDPDKSVSANPQIQTEDSVDELQLSSDDKSASPGLQTGNLASESKVEYSSSSDYNVSASSQIQTGGPVDELRSLQSSVITDKAASPGQQAENLAPESRVGHVSILEHSVSASPENQTGDSVDEVESLQLSTDHKSASPRLQTGSLAPESRVVQVSTAEHNRSASLENQTGDSGDELKSLHSLSHGLQTENLTPESRLSHGLQTENLTPESRLLSTSEHNTSASLEIQTGDTTDELKSPQLSVTENKSASLALQTENLTPELNLVHSSSLEHSVSVSSHIQRRDSVDELKSLQLSIDDTSASPGLQTENYFSESKVDHLSSDHNSVSASPDIQTGDFSDELKSLRSSTDKSASPGLQTENLAPDSRAVSTSEHPANSETQTGGSVDEVKSLQLSVTEDKSASPGLHTESHAPESSLVRLSSSEHSRSASPDIRFSCGESADNDSSNPVTTKKRRIKKHKPKLSPLFKHEVTMQLNSKSWKNFEPEKQILATEHNRNENVEEEQDSDSDLDMENSCASTQTEGRDFGMALKGKVNPEEGYQVLQANDHYKNSENIDIYMKHRWKHTSDKSLMVDINEEPSVDCLYNLFPKVPEAQMNEVLEVCHGNVTHALELMLDWGDTTPITPHDKHHLSKETFETGETIDSSGIGVTTSPSKLMDMCMKLLPKDSTSFRKIQQQVISGSEQRLQRIQSSEYVRLRNISFEDTKDSPSVILDCPPHLSHFDSALSDIESSEKSGVSSEISSTDDLEPSFLEGKGEETTHVDRVESEEPQKDILHSLPSASVGELGAEARGGVVRQEMEGQGAQGDLTLSLPASLVNSLEQLFGHLPGTDQGAACTVQLDHETAFRLYKCLTLSRLAHQAVSEEQRIRQLREDEALAQWLQQEEEVKRTLQSIDAMPVPISGSEAPKTQEHRSGQLHIMTQRISQGLKPRGRGPVKLKDIMNEEMIKEKTREKHIKQLEARGDHIAIATKLKREKLLQHFPGVDENMLEEIFEANEYCLETTVNVVASAFGLKEKRPVPHKLEMALADEDTTIEAVKQLSLQEAKQHEEYQSLDAFNRPGENYSELRQEALLHHFMRQECFRKAHDAHRRGMGDVADFYSQKGHKHFEKMKEANMRASEKLLESRHERLQKELTLDLHGFHVDEAIAALKKVIESKEKEIQHKPIHNRPYLFVITGRGKHSQQGVSRLRPALIAHLQTTGYRYAEIKPGMFKIMLSPS